MRRLLALTLTLPLAGCFFPAERGRLLEGRVDSLADENKQLKAELEKTRSELDETTAKLKAALEQLDQASRTTGANIGVRVDSAIQDIAALRGQVEAGQYKVTELEQKLASVEDKTDALAAAGTAAANTPPPEPKKEEVKRPDDPKAFLALADQKVKAGDVDLGRKLYNEFMKKWPRDAQVGEAHFKLGETYFDAKKCREALYEYGKVIQDFPRSHSAPNAYLRSADCFGELKMKDESRLALEELVKQHPKSDAAKTARQKLAALNKASKKGGKKK